MSHFYSSSLDKIRAILSRRAKNRKYIRGDNIVDYISKASGYEREEVLNGLQELKRTNELECQNWYRGEPVGRLALNLKLSRSDAHNSWLRALEKEELKPHDIESLEPIYPYVSDWEETALSNLVKGLLALRKDMPVLRGQSRYAVSARYLLSSSKIIDALPNGPLRAFGIDAAALAKPPSYLMTAGPTNPQAVLLIENPQAFELATSSAAVNDVALVATFGYGLSRAGDDFGRQLASHIESNDPLIALVRKGAPPELEALLSHSNVYFWGDLDMEGLKIFWRLKTELAQLQLSALYLPMIERLRSEGGHPYSKVSGKPNQQHWQSQNTLVDHLLSLCASRAIDQECVTSSLLEHYAAKPLIRDHFD